MRYLKSLTVGEMIGITEQWTGPLQTVFMAIPEIAAFATRVNEDHQALVSARTSGTAEIDLKVLEEDADRYDTSHDHGQRGFHFAMRSAIEVLRGQIPPDTTLADTLEAALDALQPEGLSVNNATYEGEAGNAAQMVKLAQTEWADTLKLVPVMGGKTAFDLVAEIGNVGAKLGEIEQKKSVAATTAADQTVSRSEVRRRKRAWVETVTLVVGALERAQATPEAVKSLRQPVLDGIEKARQRRLAQRRKNTPAGNEP